MIASTMALLPCKAGGFPWCAVFQRSHLFPAAADGWARTYGAGDRIESCTRATRGPRLQEDAHVGKLNFDDREDIAFFGIYDGHGGAQVAKFCAMHMPDELRGSASYKDGDIKHALKSTYLAIDERLRLKENAELLNQLKAKSTSEGNGNFAVVDASEQDASSGARP